MLPILKRFCIISKIDSFNINNKNFLWKTPHLNVLWQSPNVAVSPKQLFELTGHIDLLPSLKGEDSYGGQLETN
jgi:hypothetical protein